MTTLAVNAVSAVAQGGAQGLVQFGTQLAVSAATSAIDRLLDNRVFEGPRQDSFHLQTSRDGAPMPRVFGRARMAGQVIWASRVREIVTEESVGGKGGGPVRRDYSYTVSFAVGLCEGEILGVDRIWANGDILKRSGLTVRVHTGSEGQGPDPVIAATEPGPVPAFRGTAYIVFEDFPLDDYGARLPIINAEVVRAVRRGGRMESLVRSVNLLPGTGEFALDTRVVEETPTIGTSIPTNMNGFTGEADLIASLDQLQAELPNCRHVNVISSWFGSSLDAGQCRVRPGAERLDRRLPDREWRVAGKGRRDSYIVSADEDGRANYGGTPSDDSLISCIRELKQRGFSVTLYPFLLMDMPGFPWRGRIAANSADDVAAFFGTDHDERFRHSVLHHARLAQAAGGVDAVVIGSELKGLMASAGFAAVGHMRQLAADVRAVVGAHTKITYAADWSDYFGVQDGGDVTYHLDPLWADPNIDAVGIDAYFPLADWRDGDAHLDARPGRTGHDLDYLRANVEGGEGFDWYYASAADRDAQVRTPIDDPVYAYKNLRHWWGQPHVNRVGGQPAGQTPWVPKSKPIWLLEVGCPAVDKGANQPNVFFDGRSVDSARPYHSSGARDDLIQHRYIEALLGHYQDSNEPGFIDLDRASIWAWDARPYPYFPARLDVWSDGGNWARGHWLNGRTGLMPVADVVEEIARDSGLGALDVSGVGGVIPGYVVDRPMSARAALAPLMQLFAIEMVESAGSVVFRIGGPAPVVLDATALVAGPVRRTRDDAETRIRDVRVSYIDAARDYGTASASARQLAAESVATADLIVPAVLDEGFARHVAERELRAAHSGGETLSFALPLGSGLGFEPGDRVIHDGAVWAVESVDAGREVALQARREVRDPSPWVAGTQPETPPPVTFGAAPQLFAFDLPGRSGLSVGALLSPFMTVEVGVQGEGAALEAPLRIGATQSALPTASNLVVDRTTRLDVLVENLPLASQGEPTLRFAVETLAGWEVIAARDAELVAPSTYRLSHILRGLDGSDAFMDALPAGARVVWLGRGVATLPLSDDWRGSVVEATGESATRTARPASTVWNDLAGLPLAPVHPRWDGQTLRWTGRSLGLDGWDADDAGLRFRVRLYRGAAIQSVEVTGPSLGTTPFERAEIFGLSATGRESPYPATLIVS